MRRLEQDSEYRCHMGIIERGGQENNLHIQGVMDIFSTSPNKINYDIKHAMKSISGTLPPHLVVCVRGLTGIGTHTFLGNLGYCQKDQIMDHYKMHQAGNITPEDMQEG